ncbi:MAG TPA: sigma-70 family RNA polymerase sigma factor [Bacteroidales bacterium]|nr:sigma-70 family RNA polymerase sigma factor [Bacteroidales bacterium]
MFIKINFRSDREGDIKSHSDEKLIFQYQKTSDTKYIGEIFNRYTHLVYGVCLKYLKHEENSKDAVMQIFEDLHLKLREHKVENFKSWIYSVSKNHCLMELRKNGKEEKGRVEIYEKIRAEIMESVDVFHHNNSSDISEKIPKLKQGIKQLKTEQRTCIELLYLQNKSYLEVSEITGYSMKNVKSYIQNGKRNLKIFLEE